MTTYEWLGLIVVLIGGFWKLSNKLTKIEVVLSGKVGFDDCAEKQGKCPCHNVLSMKALYLFYVHIVYHG